MNLLELEQGSLEWRQARCGSLGASRVADAIAKTKTGWGSSRANLMAELIVERLTGVPNEGYQNDAMRWGQQTEAEARAAYEFRTDQSVATIGLVRHPNIADSHASPDGIIGDDGLLELKCPQSATHIDTLLGGSIPGKYITQVQWQLACCGRKWCDWASYDPRLPETMRLYVQRVERDDELIAALEKDVREFLVEVRRKVATLQSRFAPAPGAAQMMMAG